MIRISAKAVCDVWCAGRRIPNAMTDFGPRYAIYFAPAPESTLWRFGSAIIGYDAASGRDIPTTPPVGHDRAGWGRLTEEPRRYGFHATLKAPFRLAMGQSEAQFLATVRDFAARSVPQPICGLQVSCIGSFVALTVIGDATPINHFAADVMRAFEPYRAPLSNADRSRRLTVPLSKRQIAYLDRFGYPYVLEEFRFHLTLTGGLPQAMREPVRQALAEAYIRSVPLALNMLDALAVLKQDRRDGRFRLIERFPFPDHR
jgi:hypothetical protein